MQKHKHLSAFSLQNSIKIFNYNPESRLNTLNGVRALAMMWVVFGHETSLTIGQSQNLLTMQPKFESWSFLVIEAALFAVDTFFFVGGFFVAYVFIR